MFFEVRFFMRVIFVVCCCILTIRGQTNSLPTLVNDYNKSTLFDFLLPQLEKQTLRTVVVQTSKDCPSATDPSIYLSSTCLAVSYPSPILSLWSNGRRWLIGVGHSTEGQLNVSLTLARRCGWKNIGFWTDDREASAFFKQLSLSKGVNVSAIHLIAGNWSEETVNSSMSFPNTTDSVLVHCLTTSCVRAFLEAFRATTQYNIGWILTEDVTKETLRNAQLRNLLSHSGLSRVLGIRRDPLAEFSEESCNLLSKCASSFQKMNDVYLLDGVTLLRQLLIANSSSTLSVETIRNVAAQTSSVISDLGTIQLDSQLKGRLYSVYDVLDLSDQLLPKVASYSDGEIVLIGSTLNQTKNEAVIPRCQPVVFPFHFRVSTIVEPPVVFYDNTTDTFTGLAIDLLDELSRRLHFTYEIELNSQDKYGVFVVNDDGTVTADGLVGDVFHCKTDMVVAALSATTTRDQYLDITRSWFDYGLILLGTKPEQMISGLFAFLAPFSAGAWLLSIGCLFATALSLPLIHTILYRRSALEKTTVFYKGTAKERTLENKSMALTFLSRIYRVFWFICARQPNMSEYVSLSGKILYASWYFFSAVIVVTYTANLAAFLTVQNADNPIQNVDQLAAQTAIPYGTVRDSAVATFFQQSSVSVYAEMGRYMSSVGESSVRTSMRGVNRARGVVGDGSYVFIWDSPVLQYYASRAPCTSELLGRVFSMKQYVIAFPKGMPYTDDVSAEILMLTDAGFTYKSAGIWLDGSECTAVSQTAQINQIQVTHLAGISLFMGGAIVLSLLVTVFERVVVMYQYEPALCLMKGEEFVLRRGAPLEPVLKKSFPSGEHLERVGNNHNEVTSSNETNL